MSRGDIDFIALREELDEKQMNKDIVPDFEEIQTMRLEAPRKHNTDTLLTALQQLDENAILEVNNPIFPPFVLIKRVVRKFIRNIIAPIVNKQNVVNRQSEMLARHVVWLSEEYNELVGNFEFLQNQNNALQESVYKMRNEIVMLKKTTEVKRGQGNESGSNSAGAYSR